RRRSGNGRCDGRPGDERVRAGGEAARVRISARRGGGGAAAPEALLLEAALGRLETGERRLAGVAARIDEAALDAGVVRGARPARDQVAQGFAVERQLHLRLLLLHGFLLQIRVEAVSISRPLPPASTERAAGAGVVGLRRISAHVRRVVGDVAPAVDVGAVAEVKGEGHARVVKARSTAGRIGVGLILQGVERRVAKIPVVVQEVGHRSRGEGTRLEVAVPSEIIVRGLGGFAQEKGQGRDDSRDDESSHETSLRGAAFQLAFEPRVSHDPPHLLLSSARNKGSGTAVIGQSMNQLDGQVSRRRTFAIISHPDAGKTTLTEKLLLFGGAIQLAGAVKARGDARRARSDWMKVEQERGISVTASVMTFEYAGCTFNLLDTPGHEDFSEDTYRTLTAVDSAVMVIDAAKGIETQTRKLFEVCRLRDVPIITFINKLDR